MKQTISALIIISLLSAIPQTAWADGGASTRNIILGGAAAAGTLLIINHNKKVHERYAEDAQRQAALASERNDAQTAYASERAAYAHQLAINEELQKEVALQHRVVVRLEQELTQSKQRAAVQKAQANSVSYGWGQL